MSTAFPRPEAPPEPLVSVDVESRPPTQALSGPRRAFVLFMVQGVPLLGLGAGVWLYLREGIRPLDVGLLVGMYLLTMVGIELGFHRLFSHRAFETTRPLAALLLISGSMAGQGSMLLWTAIHRWHHAHTDVPGDLHSPTFGRRGLWQRLRGVFWAQFLWYLEIPALPTFDGFIQRHARALEHAEDGQERRFAQTLRDLLRDEWLVRLSGYQGLWVLLGLALPAAVGGLATGSWAGAWRGLVWGGFVRFFVVQQVTFAINTVTHTVGTQPLRTRDHSRNNALMALLTLGAGWHNNHHAFPGSAFTDFRWWQVDASGLLIRLLARLGWAWDVHAPSPEAIAARERT